MKKNLVLTLILFSLVFIAFFIEEKVKVDNFKQSLEAKLILPSNFEDLSQISFQGFSLIKDDKWKLSDSHYFASEEYINKFLTELSTLRIREELSYKKEDLVNFFQFQDHFIKLRVNENEMTLRLGDVNQVTGYFYILKTYQGESNLYLCEISKSLERAYQDEIQKRIFQYIEFKNLVTTSSSLAIKTGLENLVNFEKLEKVVFDPEVYRPFEVKNEGILSPLPPKGVEVIKNTFKDLKELLKEIKPISLIKKDGDPIGLISEIHFYQESEIVLKLYSTYKEKTAPFLTISSFSDYVFELDSKGLNFFYLTHQDFWSKKIHFDQNFENLHNTPFTLSFPRENKSEEFEIADFKTFSLKSVNKKKIDQKFFNLLFNILFGSDEFRQARLLGELKDLKISKKEFEVKIEIFKRHFDLIVSKKQIFVIDNENNYYLMYDYDLGDLTPKSSKDFFKD